MMEKDPGSDYAAVTQESFKEKNESKTHPDLSDRRIEIEDPMEWPYCYIVRVHSKRKDIPIPSVPGKGFGTGFVVGRNIVLTAAHVIDKIKNRRK